MYPNKRELPKPINLWLGNHAYFPNNIRKSTALLLLLQFANDKLYSFEYVIEMQWANPFSVELRYEYIDIRAWCGKM